MVVLERDHQVLAGIEESPELLFPEARQRRRRRRLLVAATVVVIVGAVAVLAVALHGRGMPSSRRLRSARTTLEATPPPCNSGQLGMSAGKSGAAAGNIGQTIVFTNTASLSCTLSGYPRVATLDAQAKEVLHASDRPNGMVGGVFEGPSIPVVTLGPGQVASAEIDGADVPVGSETSCPDYPAFLVTPPGIAEEGVRVTAGDSGSSLPGFDACTYSHETYPHATGIEVNPIVPGPTGELPPS
jgi:hypothetical protein